MAHLTPAKEWRPARFTDGDEGAPDGENPYLIVISNQPLEGKDLLLGLCCEALLVACADGGANRLKDLNLDGNEEEDCGLSMICGDMDSARPEVLDYYKKKGVGITEDHDQSSTDLMKCLKYIGESDELNTARGAGLSPLALARNQGIDIALFGGLGGRADQAFSQLHHLYAVSNQESYSWARDIYLITTESVIFLLEKGINRIHAPVKPMMFTEIVGIIPIGRPSIITTRGLEWDLKNWPTEFGGNMSTSNHIRAEVIQVETTERVLFTLEYNRSS